MCRAANNRTALPQHFFFANFHLQSSSNITANRTAWHAKSSFKQAPPSTKCGRWQHARFDAKTTTKPANPGQASRTANQTKNNMISIRYKLFFIFPGL
jgi:hypothetical protein